MHIHTLQPGDDILLGSVRVTVLAVEEGSVLLSITADGVSEVVALEVSAGRATRRASQAAVGLN